MFTIKHINPQGYEHAIECGCYAIEPMNEWGLAAVRITAYETPYRTDDFLTGWCGQREWGRRRGVHELHVMNRHGATVSSVYFTDLPAEEGVSEPQALAA